VILDTCVVDLLLAPEVLSQVISFIVLMSLSQHEGNFTKMEFVHNGKHKITMPLNCIIGVDDLNLHSFWTLALDGNEIAVPQFTAVIATRQR
jgi:hypothetical protein